MFGPFYPAPLQEQVNHAERLAELLRSGRLLSGPLGPGDDWAAAWMSGREEEIERFLELTLAGRAQGKVDDATAAAILAGYIASLHDGMARILGLHRPPCCGGSGSSEKTTAPPPPGDLKSRAAQSVEELLANLGASWTEPGGGGAKRTR
ncbi:MAG TPA: hypothetical protein VF765_16415 [Polyangiaceae bacterium]